MNRRFESFCLTVLVALVVGLIGFFMGLDSGRDSAKASAMKAAAAAYAKLTATNKATVEAERELRRVERTSYEKYYKAQEKKTYEADRLIADLRADTRRLRVPVRRVPGACPVQGGSATAGTGEEGHAELSPDAGEFLVSLLKRGDTAILKHAEVVDRYDRLAAACAAHNSPPPTTEAPDATP